MLTNLYTSLDREQKRASQIPEDHFVEVDSCFFPLIPIPSLDFTKVQTKNIDLPAFLIEHDLFYEIATYEEQKEIRTCVIYGREKEEVVLGVGYTSKNLYGIYDMKYEPDTLDVGVYTFIIYIRGGQFKKIFVKNEIAGEIGTKHLCLVDYITEGGKEEGEVHIVLGGETIVRLDEKNENIIEFNLVSGSITVPVLKKTTDTVTNTYLNSNQILYGGGDTNKLSQDCPEYINAMKTWWIPLSKHVMKGCIYNTTNRSMIPNVQNIDESDLAKIRGNVRLLQFMNMDMCNCWQAGNDPSDVIEYKDQNEQLSSRLAKKLSNRINNMLVAQSVLEETNDGCYVMGGTYNGKPAKIKMALKGSSLKKDIDEMSKQGLEDRMYYGHMDIYCKRKIPLSTYTNDAFSFVVFSDEGKGLVQEEMILNQKLNMINSMFKVEPHMIGYGENSIVLAGNFLNRKVVFKVAYDLYQYKAIRSEIGFGNILREKGASEYNVYTPIWESLNKNISFIVYPHYETCLQSLPNKSNPEVISSVVKDISTALAFIFSLGYVYLDMRPANIIQDNEGRFHIIGMGLVMDIKRKYNSLYELDWLRSGTRYEPRCLEVGETPSFDSSLESLFYLQKEMEGFTLPWLKNKERASLKSTFLKTYGFDAFLERLAP